ncbi:MULTISPECIES: hypothetical protein [Deinococcus]|uniref:Uncharacterized protein n=1 Tax=Deinococcus rufus TaxID=2136097 RepID=A0ABV7ZCU7_9DEIO|nr:hypothetical protein [Deinococcus sp. AB2017081]WQE94021.1 hypothetical protein U2P90_11440 [Deinococcus sp. AB2017081]
MKNVALLTSLLALAGTATSAQETALQTWVDTHLPVLITKAQELLRPPFTIGKLMALAEEAVTAVQELKGVFSGQQRAKAAQLVLIVAARAALPDMVEPWVIPLLSGDGITAFIEAAFQKVFGPEAVPAAGIPVDPSGGDNALGRPATDSDFAPSFNDAPLDTTPKP